MAEEEGSEGEEVVGGKEGEEGMVKRGEEKERRGEVIGGRGEKGEE